MMGLWSMLPQFKLYEAHRRGRPDIHVRNWSDVIWALSTRFDPAAT